MNRTIKALIVATIFIVSILSSVGATYYFLDKEINNLTTEHEYISSELNNQIYQLMEMDQNRNDFDYYLISGFRNIVIAAMNEVLATDNIDSAELLYADGDYESAEIYYSYASTYFNYATDSYKESKLNWSKAQEYATNDKTIEFIGLYLAQINSSIEVSELLSDMQSNMALACSWYKGTFYQEGGDTYLTTYNFQIEEYNELVESYNDIFNDIDFFWEYTWEYNQK